MKTTDAGNSWFPQASGVDQSLRSVYFTDANTGYAVGSNGTMLKTTDGGTAWIALDPGTPFETFTSVSFPDDSTGYAVTGFPSDGGIFKTIDAGDSWNFQDQGPIESLNAVFFVDTNIGYIVGDNGIILKTTNGGVQAQWIQTNLPNTDVYSLAVNGSNLFAGTGGRGVFLSTNNGTSWTAVNNGLTTRTVYSLVVNGPNLFAGTLGGVFLSTNNGISWTAVNNGLTDDDVLSLAVNGSNLFAGISGGGVFLSTDNGTSWTAVNAGLTDTRVWSLAVNGLNLFAGTEYDGVFLSTNNGTSWTTVNTGLTRTYVRSLAVSGSNLFAGTFYGGVWRRPLSEMIPTPSCVGNGDVNNDGTLTPGDALCAFQIYLNAGVLPSGCDVSNFECELLAADVSCDSSITPGDALAIFQRYLQNLPPQECFGKALLAKTERQARPYQISLHQQKLAPSQEEFNRQDIVKLSLLVNNPAGLNAFGLRLHYPSDKLELLTVQRANLTAEWMQLEGRFHSPGEIIIGGFHDKPVAEVSGGVLFDALFASKGQTSAADFTLSHLSDAFSSIAQSDGEAGLLHEAEATKDFKLVQNYPNPFNPSTTIRYQLPKAAHVVLKIYNLSGQEVRTLVNAQQPAGANAVVWDGRDESGKEVSSGIYIYRLHAGEFAQSRKLSFVR